ncbi:helix-turn-helix domain-containing protein [Natrarchaeobaculum aegyptiacum]|uniref:Bacterio-opsin activator n=1 Tax=Natrarchaeobaculum aegyptiacum TaxID=745377 RepID=A0A2Z2HRN2_9EURY|nr:helix-turn-helix domain-containing protein [Natrarchaeobaculum aegyptiacum]ARS89826.1 bacterio-opsin activator [Natrarchaeobaculum aegyptiacum]
MKSACVSLTHDAETLAPIHAAICDAPAIDREVILGGQSVDGVETITSFVYGDATAYESILERLETVREYDVTPAEDGFFCYLRRELEAEGLSLLDALAQETVVVVPPIEVRSDRTIRLTIVGHPSDLTRVFERVADGVTVDVLWASDSVTVSGAPVSDRQLAALEVARELGFYEVPRRNGIEAVADELDCAVSTASELLRRGEAAAVERVLEDTR